MNNNDAELFELCKKVYEKTGWETPDWFDLDPDGNPEEYLCNTEEKIDENDYIAHYTSDYLLEKLPEWTIVTKIGNDTGNYNASNELGYTTSLGYTHLIETSDTPLKSLLKLTIALHKTGIEL